MRRRDFLKITAASASIWPDMVNAQQSTKIARIGWMSVGSPTANDANMTAFRRGMSELGYIEDKTFAMEPRFGDGKDEVLPEQATELERMGVDAIVAGPYAALLAAKKSTTRVPIVMTPSADPVVTGIVKDLVRPGGNITGITEMMPELTPERIRLLKEVVPTLSRLAIMWRPGTLSEQAFEQMIAQSKAVAEASVAIDGSKFKAVNTRDRNFTQAKMQRRLAQIDESIARYLSQLDSADRQGEVVPEAKITRLNEKIATLRQEIQRLNALNIQMMQTEDKQISLTDPDARSMATSGRGSGMVGYNVQSAVDTKHHLIVAHEVTNVGSDRSQLSHMTERARAAIGSEAIEAVADRGYYNGEEILACEEAGATVYLPKPLTSGVNAKGRFGKQDFVYVAADDVYLCPAGERLIYHFTNEEDGKTLRRYWTTTCQGCALKGQCTTGKERRISRWEHEAVLEAVQARLDRHPAKMRLRRQTVEHPFGTIKSWMGSTHFQMKTLKHVRTEMALHVLAYNMKRVMSILGVGGLMEAIRA